MAQHEGMIHQHADFDLNDPVMIVAFRGWNDAGEAASFAADHLARVWDGQPMCSIDPEEFYDFQSVRPTVELIDGITRQINWPANDFLAVRLPGSAHDVIVLIGTEPSIRWKTFASLVVEVARRNGVQFVISLGALLADVPHSRPVAITGTAISDELVARLGLQRSRYEGPTGIIGVLHDAFSRAEIQSASLWAAVPHYLAISPNPKAALALIDKTVALVGEAADVSDLQSATVSYEERVSQIVEGDSDVQAYVRMLEERTDEREEDAALEDEDLPSGDALAAELERFLRDRDEGG